MRWFAGALLLVGSGMAGASWAWQWDVDRQRTEWKAAFEHVRAFDRRVSKAEFSGNRACEVQLTIPSDPDWKRVMQRAKYLNFAISKSRTDGYAFNPIPKRPLEPFEASVRVNGSPAAMEVALVSVEHVQRWGLSTPVRLGDRVDVTLTAPSGPSDADGSLLLTVDYHIVKDRSPWFQFSLDELYIGVLRPVGFIIAGAGGLICLFLYMARKVSVDG